MEFDSEPFDPVEVDNPLAILVVDDDLAMRNSVRRVLMLDGYRVEMAASGAEVLDIQNLSQFFAILLDRRLPDMDASEIVTELRQRAPSAAILIITGYADMGHTIESIRQGIDDYLVKPVEPETLRTRLGALAEHYRVKRQYRIAQQRLVQSERLAAIGQMVAGLAHESRNALQRARSCLDLLELDLKEQAEQLDMTQRIRDALEDLQRIYEEVRNYAAPIVLQYQHVDCVRLLDRAFDDLLLEFPTSKQKLVIQPPASSSPLFADEFRLLQVFRNLLENAMAASTNDAAIEVSFNYQMNEGRKFFVITFKDYGAGMDETTLSQIFEPFFTTKQSGTGLGMAICKRIIESHGGTIMAKSEKGIGTTIVVALPVQTR
jgi:signal transduction histidine kinase